MSFFEIIAVLLALTGVLSYLNHKVLGLPSTIGLMVLSLGLSLGQTDPTAYQAIPL